MPNTIILSVCGGDWGLGGGAAGITGYVGNTCRFPLHIATLVPGSAELGYFIITM